MTLVVEDGTGLANAESYASIAECDAYATAHGLSVWTGTDTVKEIALRKATQYLDTAYGWRYERSYPAVQALEWPRTGWAWSDPVTSRLKAACCELAVKALTADLFADVEAQHVTAVTVGPIQKSMSAPANGGQKRFASVDALLRGMTRGGVGMEIVRA